MSRPKVAQEAGDYFNSLPIEQRRKLAPLLEDYRRMGLEEAHVAIRSASRKVSERARRISAPDAIAFTTNEGPDA